MRLRFHTLAVASIVAIGVLVALRARLDGDEHIRQAMDVAPVPADTGQAPRLAGDAEEVVTNDGATVRPGSQTLRMEPHVLSTLGVELAPVVSPEWSDAMEARILNHVSLFSGVALTTLQAQCVESQCLVLMQAAASVDAFKFEFDEFAKANGFKSAVIGSIDGDARRRIITLQR